MIAAGAPGAPGLAPNRGGVASPGKRAFLIRVQPEILAAIEQVAAAELRSANAQIEFMLREALARRGARPKAKKGGGGASGEKSG